MFKLSKSLMNMFSFPVKLVVIGTIFIIPVAMLVFFLVKETDEFIEFGAKERIGVKYIDPLMKLLHEAGDYRMLGVSGADDFSALEKTISSAKEAHNLYSKELGTNEAFSGVIQKLNKHDKTGRALYDGDTAAIGGINSLIALASDNSNITLDPDVDTYYLGDTVVTKTPSLMEGVSQAVSLSHMVLARKQLTGDEKTELIIVQGAIQAARDGIVGNIGKAMKTTPSLKPKLEKELNDTVSAVNSFLDIYQKSVIEAQSITPKALMETGDKVDNTIFALYTKVKAELDGLLEARVSKLTNKKHWMVSTSLILLFIGFYLAFGFYLSLEESLKRMGDGLREVADGNLGTRVVICSKDEVGVMAANFNMMAQNLKELVTSVVRSADEVAAASTQLTATAERTAAGLEGVAERTTTVSAAGEQMAATSEDVARNAEKAAECSRISSRAAESGAVIFEETVSVMGQISSKVEMVASSIEALGDRSNKIGEIADTIEDIADQTNLLALNAAIEAARAGESGKGFAVVADEVRALAERTSSATRQINEMIKAIQLETKNAVTSMQEGVNEVSKGTATATKSGDALNEIRNAINDAVMQISHIATAATEQTATVNDVSTHITGIKDIIDETARVAQESATASIGMAKLADELRTQVARFSM